MNRLVIKAASAAAIVASSSLAGATGALAANPQTTQPAASTANGATNPQAVETATLDKKVCRRLPSTGTRMAKRACLTREQWKEIEESDRF